MLPPHLAPIQVVIVPIYKNDPNAKKIDAKKALLIKSKAMGILKYDNADNKRPGFKKFVYYELKGVLFAW